jgi:hypothetical protein
MARSDGSDQAAPVQLDETRAALDHLAVAPTQAGGVAVTLTLTIELSDAAALDMVMKVIGQIARARGLAAAP